VWRGSLRAVLRSKSSSVSRLPSLSIVLATAVAVLVSARGASAENKSPSCRGTFVFYYWSQGPCTNGQAIRRTYAWYDCDTGQTYSTRPPPDNCNVLQTYDEPLYFGWDPQSDNQILSWCMSAPPDAKLANTCFPKDEPDQCHGGPAGGDAPADPAHKSGDPVDLTNGRLQWTPTDLDLGPGLHFTRHYSSGQTNRLGQMGKAWRHALEWRPIGGR